MSLEIRTSTPTGAAIGSAIPVPGLVPATGFSGSFLRSLPPLAGAFVFAGLGANAIALHRDGRLTGSNLRASMDWLATAAQVAGSALGANLATATVPRGLLPALRLGPVAVVPILAGIAGALLANHLLNLVRGTPGGLAPGERVREVGAARVRTGDPAPPPPPPLARVRVPRP